MDEWFLTFEHNNSFTIDNIDSQKQLPVLHVLKKKITENKMTLTLVLSFELDIINNNLRTIQND